MSPKRHEDQVSSIRASNDGYYIQPEPRGPYLCTVRVSDHGTPQDLLSI